MTRLLQEVLQRVAELSDERQDDAAHVLLAMLESGAPRYRLSGHALEEIDLAMAEADAGRLASDEDVDAILHRAWV